MRHRFLISLSALPFVFASAAFGQTAGMLSFQGLLKDGNGDPITGSVNLEFRIYDALTGGNLVDMDGNGTPQDVFGLDAKQQLGVVATNGIVSTKFGPVSPKAFNGNQRWLEVRVNGSSLSRVEMVTAPATAEQVNAHASGMAELTCSASGRFGLGGPPDVFHRLTVRKIGESDGLVALFEGDNDAGNDPRTYVGIRDLTGGQTWLLFADNAARFGIHQSGVFDRFSIDASGTAEFLTQTGNSVLNIRSAAPNGGAGIELIATNGGGTAIDFTVQGQDLQTRIARGTAADGDLTFSQTGGGDFSFDGPSGTKVSVPLLELRGGQPWLLYPDGGSRFVINQSGVSDRFTIDASGATEFLTTAANSVVNIRSNASSGGAGIELIANSGGGTAIDFTVAGQDFQTRIARDTAANGDLVFSQTGGGDFAFYGPSGTKVSVPVLEIRGGADLAEPFEIGGTGDTSDVINPGMVVAIDTAHPGKLTLATQTYDRKVAGVISGANGLSPGMVMRSEGDRHADGTHNLALTGRVWCWCDASFGAIEPGDRLTTSGTPGHAMKVTDNVRAIGAVIGKAMTPLTEGRGLVLVLIQPH